MVVVALIFGDGVIYYFLPVIMQVMRILLVQKQDVCNKPASSEVWSW